MFTKLFNNTIKDRFIYLKQGSAYVQANAVRASKARAKKKAKRKTAVLNKPISHEIGAKPRSTISNPSGNKTISKVKYAKHSVVPTKKKVRAVSNAVYKPNRLNFNKAESIAEGGPSRITFGNTLIKSIEDRNKSGENDNVWSIDRFNKTATQKQKDDVTKAYNKIKNNERVSNVDYGKSVSVFNKLKNLSTTPENNNAEAFSIKPSEPSTIATPKAPEDNTENGPTNTVEVLNELDKGKGNPFNQGTKEYDLFEKLKGMNVLDEKLANDELDRFNAQRESGIGLINNTFDIKKQMLEEQATEANRDKEAETKHARDRMMFGEVGLEEGRKRALRYLKGALAQRGAYGTTGTGKYNLSYLMSQYDIKDADLKQEANKQISDVEKQFYNIQRKINDTKLINESEKRKLLYELDKETNRAISNVMKDLRNKQRAVEMKSFELGYAEQQAEDSRNRAKDKELRDYIIKRIESGEYVPQDVKDKVIANDSDYKYLVGASGETGRENISSAVTGVYEDMLGGDWATKTNPRTGRTFKDEATETVVDLVNGGMKLEDALNRVRNAINNDPYFSTMKAYGLAKKAPRSSGSGSGSGSDKLKYRGDYKLDGIKRTVFNNDSGGMYYYDQATGATKPIILNDDSINKIDKIFTPSSITKTFEALKDNETPIQTPSYNSGIIIGNDTSSNNFDPNDVDWSITD